MGPVKENPETMLFVGSIFELNRNKKSRGKIIAGVRLRLRTRFVERGIKKPGF